MSSEKKSKKSKKKKSHKSKKHKDNGDLIDENLKKESKKEHKLNKRDRSRSLSSDRKRKKVESDYKKETHYHHHHHHHYYHKSKSRSLSRNRSRSVSKCNYNNDKDNKNIRKRSKSRESNNKYKIDKKKLLEIAKANVNKSSIQLKLTNIKIEESSQQFGPTKTINELVEYCKKLTNDLKDDDDDDVENYSYKNNLNENDNKINHPFEKKEFPFNIKLDSIENETSTEIHNLFPVSSGCEHRNKENVSKDDKVKITSEEYIEKLNNQNKEDDIDNQLNVLLSQRIELVKKLNKNPTDLEAQILLDEINLKVQNWANSKQIPGQFTGITGVKFLAPHELEGQYIAWTRKDLMIKATPITEGIGKKLLEKMGWKQGEGLGKKKEGTVTPLALDIKTDRKGLVSQEEIVKSKTIDLSTFPENKHPINTLIEYCKIKKWPNPEFEVVMESGPPHLRVFLMKVTVNDVSYQPSCGSTTKKMAKTNAAILCLQSLGIMS